MVAYVDVLRARVVSRVGRQRDSPLIVFPDLRRTHLLMTKILEYGTVPEHLLRAQDRRHVFRFRRAQRHRARNLTRKRLARRRS